MSFFPANDGDANLARGVARIRVGSDIDPWFVRYALQDSQIQKLIRRVATGSTFREISLEQLRKIQIALPPLFQQRRIAKVLRAWDDAIEQLGRLIQAKGQFIRGMLAESVSDGRTVAKHDDWEKTTIGEVTTPAQQRVTWDEAATYRLITVRRRCGGLVFRGDRKGHEILTKDMYTVRAGDFLISKRQVVHGAWAMVTPEFDGGHVSKEYACLRAKPGKLWMPYFDWLSRTERLQHEAFICSYGVDIEKMVLNVDWLLQTPLLLPRSIETQKAMAAGLDCLQREVQLLQAQMEALNKQKRGLMQKLLTGEWRVPVREGDVDAMAARVTEEAAQ
jgi:type I restriction enzyme S subunit